MSIEATLLTEEQIWGDDHGNGQLQVMKTYGTQAGMSDLAIVLGGVLDYGMTSDNQPAGFICSASSNNEFDPRLVRGGGGKSAGDPGNRVGGARPTLPSSATSSIKPNEARGSRKIGDIEVMEYGEYPQTIASNNATLEQAFASNPSAFAKTGKEYTFDAEPWDAYNRPFRAEECLEYRYHGKKYIRVTARRRGIDSALSNGHMPEAGEPCWIEVRPIEWLVDPSGVWVARQALFSGVQFDRKLHYDGNFANTDMKRYLDQYFSKEMLPFKPVVIDPAWQTFTVKALAGQMREDKDFSRLPILADGLQDAGCENADILDHCRGAPAQYWKKWFMDALLGPETPHRPRGGVGG